MCIRGTQLRTELFIHSNGIEGTAWDSNYKTQGCIKIAQVNRSTLQHYWELSLDRENELLQVL